MATSYNTFTRLFWIKENLYLSGWVQLCVLRCPAAPRPPPQELQSRRLHLQRKSDKLAGRRTSWTMTSSSLYVYILLYAMFGLYITDLLNIKPVESCKEEHLRWSYFYFLGRWTEAVWSDNLQLMWDGLQRGQPRGQLPAHPVPPAVPGLHQICGKRLFIWSFTELPGSVH